MFRLVELAVREHWRGQGIVRRLHEALLDSIEAERVLLNATRAAGQQGSVSCLSGVGIPQGRRGAAVGDERRPASDLSGEVGAVGVGRREVP